MSPLLNDWDRQVYRDSAQGQDVRHMNIIFFFILKDMLQPTIIGEKQHMRKMDTGSGQSDNSFTSIFQEQTPLKLWQQPSTLVNPDQVALSSSDHWNKVRLKVPSCPSVTVITE